MRTVREALKNPLFYCKRERERERVTAFFFLLRLCLIFTRLYMVGLKARVDLFFSLDASQLQHRRYPAKATKKTAAAVTNSFKEVNLKITLFLVARMNSFVLCSSNIIIKKEVFYDLASDLQLEIYLII